MMILRKGLILRHDSRRIEGRTEGERGSVRNSVGRCVEIEKLKSEREGKMCMEV